MIQTVIFDMDGVIVDTEPVHHYAYFQHFDELNITVTEEMFTSYMGNSTRNTFQKLKETFDLQHDVEDLILRKRTLFNDAFDKKEDLFLLDGVEKLIKELHQNGMQLIVASSASKLLLIEFLLVLDYIPIFHISLVEKIFPNLNHIPLFLNMLFFYLKLQKKLVS
jgi:beta-phosphoglucomutase-like phosphatase (HAD superfamily)